MAGQDRVRSPFEDLLERRLAELRDRLWLKLETHEVPGLELYELVSRVPAANVVIDPTYGIRPSIHAVEVAPGVYEA